MNAAGPRGRAPQGSRPVGEGGGTRKRGLLWLLLALLALLVVAGLVLALRGGGDDESASTGTTPAPTSESAPSASATGAAANPPAGSFAAASTSWTPGASSIAEATGQDAEGSGLEVQEVVAGRGFWVGRSATDRGYVELGGQAGVTEDAPTPKVGDTVTLSGPVRPVPDDPEQTLGLDATGAEQLTQQGAYVNAEEVTVG